MEGQPGTSTSVFQRLVCGDSGRRCESGQPQLTLVGKHRLELFFRYPAGVRDLVGVGFVRDIGGGEEDVVD